MLSALLPTDYRPLFGTRNVLYDDNAYSRGTSRLVVDAFPLGDHDINF